MFSFCPHCGQTLEQDQAEGQSLVCRYCHKPIGDVATAGKGTVTRDLIKVLAGKATGDIGIVQLTLEYLDQADRIRLQIDALRDILGPDFRMKPYPAQFNRSHLALWGNAAACVIAKKHAQGGYQQMCDDELRQVVKEVREHRQLFFPSA